MNLAIMSVLAAVVFGTGLNWSALHRQRESASVVCTLVATTERSAPRRPPLSKWAGLYRKADDGIIGIAELHEFGESHIFIDYGSGEAGRLFDLPDGRTGVGRSIGEGSPPTAHVLERKKGRTLLDARPKGALVLVHGSGPGPRRAYDTWSNFFVSRGWAVVVFDKRGSGSSSGDWHEADFNILADDLRAVLKWSRSQPELTGLSFGLWGVSQAGWIIPQLAADKAIDFAIVQAGPSTPTDEFIGRTVESELRAYEFSAEEIQKAKTYYELDAAVSRGEKPFSAIVEAYREASAAGAEWLLKAPDPEDAPDRRFMAKIAGYDPAPNWRRVRIPLLILFGGKDHVVPVEPNRGRFEALLAEAGNGDAEIVTLPDNNHLNMLAKTGVRTEYPSLNRFDPEYFRTLSRFLSAREAQQ